MHELWAMTLSASAIIVLAALLRAFFLQKLPKTMDLQDRGRLSMVLAHELTQVTQDEFSRLIQAN